MGLLFQAIYLYFAYTIGVEATAMETSKPARCARAAQRRTGPAARRAHSRSPHPLLGRGTWAVYLKQYDCEVEERGSLRQLTCLSSRREHVPSPSFLLFVNSLDENSEKTKIAWPERWKHTLVGIETQ